MDGDFVKKRLEKDLLELKKMIDTHFEQRKKDEQELTGLEERIEKRKDVRQQQLEERQRVYYFDISGLFWAVLNNMDWDGLSLG